MSEYLPGDTTDWVSYDVSDFDAWQIDYPGGSDGIVVRFMDRTIKTGPLDLDLAYQVRASLDKTSNTIVVVVTPAPEHPDAVWSLQRRSDVFTWTMPPGIRFNADDELEKP